MPRSIAKALALAIAAIAALSLAGVADAAAATRFAKPQGTGSAPCTDPANPCTLFLAADSRAGVAQSGDEVVLAPGTYGDADLGPSTEQKLTVKEGVSIHGDPTKPRPLIAASGSRVLVEIRNGTISHLQLQNSGAGAALHVLGGAVEDVIASARGGAGCEISDAASTTPPIIRGSVCLTSAEGNTAALSTEVSTEVLRNVTAIATGQKETFGAIFSDPGFVRTRIDAKSVIVEGPGTDILASVDENNTDSIIELKNSDYDSTRIEVANGAGATVTQPGTNGNIQAAPKLAADGFHELPGSPTIDAGIVDSESATLDVDRQPRALGAGADIGADELGQSASSLRCSPASLPPAGGVSTCIVTLSDPSAGQLPPAGTVTFTATGAGALGAASCALKTDPATGKASCQVTYTPKAASGSHTIAAAYPGDLLHGSSQAVATVTDSGAGGLSAAPQTRIVKKPKKRSAQSRASFRFASDQPRSTFECKLDKKPFRRCGPSFAVKVKPGRHTLKVRAVSAKGIKDPTPATFRWRVVAG